ncbi:MAG TPA: MFS transporter [Dongiaceae bacterium]|jgi:predicted MFS family arabinose efflux permease|nr:MFS transporter [Dongiaceae bacterium]
MKNPAAKLALRFVLIIGVVQLFADMTYEGARSSTGPFLGSLGASATAIGFTAGFGELIGYSLRSVSGYFADKTHKYWIFIFTGYAINLLAVPALALAGNWPLAAALVVAERTGRAIRKPSTDAMLSHAGSQIGHGWAFGLNEFLDQTGATIGPLIMALVLYFHGGYHKAFAILLIPALLCLAAVTVARILYPRPHELEKRAPVVLKTKGFSKAYWLYVVAGALIAAGFADFSLVAFHFQKTATVPQSAIPIFYAAAMVTGALAALVFGKLLDKIGMPVVVFAFFIGAFFSPCVFLGGFGFALAGMILWGIGMGAQDSLLKAVLSGVIPQGKRSTAFGVFDTIYGIAWFAGSATMGLLYDKSIFIMIIFSVALQLAALPVFILAKRREKKT